MVVDEGLGFMVDILEIDGKLLLVFVGLFGSIDGIVEFDFGLFEFECLLLDFRVEFGLVFEFGVRDDELLSPLVLVGIDLGEDVINLGLFLLCCCDRVLEIPIYVS